MNVKRIHFLDIKVGQAFWETDLVYTSPSILRIKISETDYVVIYASTHPGACGVDVFASRPTTFKPWRKERESSANYYYVIDAETD